MDEKEYNVSFDMKYSHNFTVKAKSVAEAKKKGFDKFKSKRNQRAQYTVYCDEI